MDEAVVFVLRLFAEFVVELSLRGPGYLLLKLSGSTDVDPDGLLVIVTGIAFWGVIGLVVWVAVFL